MKNVTLFLFAILCASCQQVQNKQLSKEVIEKYIDRDVRVFGSYAVVKTSYCHGSKSVEPRANRPRTR